MIYIGTILEVDNKKTYVFTMDCGITPIKTKNDYYVGKQISFSKKDIINNNILHKSIFVKSLISVAAVFAIVFSMILIKPLLNSDIKLDSKAVAVVSIDINPSIEINLNKDELIVSATSKNEDGQKVLDTLDLTGLPLKEGVDKIVSCAKDMGYIKDNKKIVLVSAAMNEGSQNASRDYAIQLKSILTTLEQDKENATVLTVFIEDNEIIDSAKENDLSIGREFLYKYAESQEGDLTADEVRQGTLVDLLETLDALDENNEELGEDIKQKATEIIVQNEFSAKVLVNTVKNGIQINWEKAQPADNFKGYKIVASKNNAVPVYPDDGYLLYVEDIDTVSKIIKSNSAYNGGDIGGTLLAGQNYYFSVSYIYEDEIINGNSVLITMPEVVIDTSVSTEATTEPSTEPTTEDTTETTAETTTETTEPGLESVLNISTTDDTMNFSWIPVSDPVSLNDSVYLDFKYYKVVASKTNPNPKYPDDGYLTYITDINTSSWSLNPSMDSYNKSPELIPGETYYFSITYVFETGKFSSNTVQMKVPETAQSIPEFEPQFNMSITGDKLSFLWLPVEDKVKSDGEVYSGFKYYKVVASRSNPNPKYPDDGYIKDITDINTFNWSVNPLTDYYNKSPELIPGKKYYFSITYVFENGKIYSNTIQMEVPGATQPAVNINPTLAISSSEGNLSFSWTKAQDAVTYNGDTYSDFLGYKVVAAKTNANPVYPDDGYLEYISNMNTSSWSINPSTQDYRKDPELVSGEKYYFSITYLYEGKKFTSNVVEYTIP